MLGNEKVGKEQFFEKIKNVTIFEIRLCVLIMSTCLYLAYVYIRLLNIFKISPGSSLYVP